MHRFAVFLVSVVALANTDVDVRHCFETAAAFSEECCRFNITEEKAAILRECVENHDRADHQNCDIETCYGQKVGYLLSNGTIDKTLLEAMIEKEYENNTDLKEIVKEKCLVDDLSNYGPPHMCYVRKTGNCLLVHRVLNCPHWEDSERCNKVKNILEECKSVFP